jgi:23S rRNA-/tRNA-specific pseudouridylate synthase
MKCRVINNKIKKLREHGTHTQIINNQTKHTFYKSTENLTDVIFTDREMQILNKELKYNVHHRHKTWRRTLAIEADTAVSQLPEKTKGI